MEAVLLGDFVADWDHSYYYNHFRYQRRIDCHCIDSHYSHCSGYYLFGGAQRRNRCHYDWTAAVAIQNMDRWALDCQNSNME